MNNAKLTIENINLEVEERVDIRPALRSRQEELALIIEAIENIKASSYWKVLEDKVFKGVHDSLLTRLKSEKEPIDIYRLQGQLMWAEKYLDLDKFMGIYKLELQNIRSKINQS